MMQQGGTAESRIKAVIEAWADAVRRHDLSGILAHHEQDIVMFDVPPPLQSRGMDDYKKTWDLFFRYHKPSQAFDIEELAITAGEDVAFAVAIVRCGSGSFGGPPEQGGFLFRLTIGLRNIDGDWRIAHEHHSVPSTDWSTEPRRACISTKREACPTLRSSFPITNDREGGPTRKTHHAKVDHNDSLAGPGRHFGGDCSDGCFAKSSGTSIGEPG